MAINQTTEERVKKVKKIMGKDADGYTDEQLLQMEDDMRTLANIIIDKYLSMKPAERKKWHKEHVS